MYPWVHASFPLSLGVRHVQISRALIPSRCDLESLKRIVHPVGQPLAGSESEPWGINGTLVLLHSGVGVRASLGME
jgi:hypothetical protein